MQLLSTVRFDKNSPAEKAMLETGSILVLQDMKFLRQVKAYMMTNDFNMVMVDVLKDTSNILESINVEHCNNSICLRPGQRSGFFRTIVQGNAFGAVKKAYLMLEATGSVNVWLSVDGGKTYRPIQPGREYEIDGGGTEIQAFFKLFEHPSEKTCVKNYAIFW